MLDTVGSVRTARRHVIRLPQTPSAMKRHMGRNLHNTSLWSRPPSQQSLPRKVFAMRHLAQHAFFLLSSPVETHLVGSSRCIGLSPLTSLKEDECGSPCSAITNVAFCPCPRPQTNPPRLSCPRTTQCPLPPACKASCGFEMTTIASPATDRMQ